MIKSLFSKKEAVNAGWLIGGRIAQMALSFVVGIITARYLGPGNYGLINYGLAYVSFFTAFCTLGLNAVIIKDFVDHPEDEGESIGTTIGLRFASSVLSAIMITGIVSILDKGEPETIVVVALCSIALVFQVFDTFNYWFQSKYNSKTTSIATLIAYVIVSAYKIVLLVLEKNVQWFAFSTALDYIVIAVFLFVAYRLSNGPKLSFSINKGKALLGKSYHYILSSMMVAIYGQTDKLMLKQMMNDTEVGYYSVATALCTVWVFVLQAIIDSMYPTILNLFGKDNEAFRRKNKQLYALVFYISCFVSVLITAFARLGISIMYGEQFLGAITPLRIVTWYTAFSYLGVARNAWIVCNDKQKYLKFIYFGAAVLNVALNAILIPIYGASGAAMASLVTQIFTSIILPYLIPEMRENAKMMLEAIMLQGMHLKKV